MNFVNNATNEQLENLKREFKKTEQLNKVIYFSKLAK